MVEAFLESFNCRKVHDQDNPAGGDRRRLGKERQNCL